MNAVTVRLERIFSETEDARRVGELLAGQLQSLYDAVNPDLTGGAILLGVRGVCMIAHGSSNDLALANSIRLAAQMADHDMVEVLRASLNG